MHSRPAVETAPTQLLLSRGQLIASFPSRFARTYLELFHQLAPEHQVTFCSHSLGADVDMRVNPRLTPAEWLQWDTLFEAKTKELAWSLNLDG